MNERIQAILNKLTELVDSLSGKQDKLYSSGTNQNVKTINNNSILGTGNIEIEGFSGDYNDLTNKPTLFSGDYDALTNKPPINKPLIDGNKIATMLDVSSAQQIQVTLMYIDWYSTPDHWQIDVTATGVTANNAVIVSPAPSSTIYYNDAEVMAILQGTDSLSFSATRQPTDNITVNVLIVG